MSVWAMAVAGWFRGEVDAVAVRLPSVVAVVLTSLVLYWYTRLLISRRAALAAALAYATFAQVLQIGRMGESEAVFTLLASASLLFWHAGYSRGWKPLATWSLGFGLAALAALVKGPQAPVYFVAITAVYLAVRRDWRFLVCWQYAAGAAVFAAIIAAWQVPFYLATDWETSVATWAGLATDRVHLGGLLTHIALYPLETFACLLPWSPLLVALLKRETRTLLADQSPLVSYLLVAFAVSYPTVWFVAGAEPRYFMPLYPLVAVLVGMVIDRLSVATPGRYPRHAWHQFLLLHGTWITACGLAVGFAGLAGLDLPAQLNQPRANCIAFSVIAIFAAITLFVCYRQPQRIAPTAAVVAIASIAAAAYSGFVISRNAARWNDPTPLVAELKSYVAEAESLVSLTPIDHRFAYYYGAPIAELGWPQSLNDIPAEAEYFCFMRNPADTADQRAAGRGRSWTTTPGTLPFAWQEVTSICVERRLRDGPRRTVVLGRIIRPIQAAVSDATVPQVAARTRSGVER
jgi:4-amino-4-deoxy-L-arabinose transferase-like glycosyltransferase